MVAPLTQSLDEILATLEAAAERKKFRRIDFFTPYPKQREFIRAGQFARERLLMAGNQLGKTECGAYETAKHLTGDYPKDWVGRRFTKPTRAWAAGESSLLVRDVQQSKLCGPPGAASEFGIGMIPREAFDGKPSLSRGVTDAFDTIAVKHLASDGASYDGISTLTFKSYEQGRKKFQGEPIDFGWMDEEPDEDIYSEILTRVTATRGMVFTTFTPLNGMTALVMKFMHEGSSDRRLITFTINEAEHILPEERARIIAGYPAHEREARANGVPLLGNGRIFETAEANIAEPLMEYVPSYWPKIWAIDFGIGHPFAAVLAAWDRDNDVLHILHAIRMADTLPIQHAAAMKPYGHGVPVAWPKDGADREKGSGETLASVYRKHDLVMLPQPAMWPDGGNSTEAGITEMDERFRSNRLRVAAHLSEWFEEYRMYHRSKGLIVKVRDDLMSATRVLVMARRHARVVELGLGRQRRRNGELAKDVDFDFFGG